MKFNKIAKKFAAAVLAGVLAVSSMGMTAKADTVSSVSFSKTVEAEENVLAPATSFTFAVAPVTSDTTWTYTDIDNVEHTVVIYAGVSGGAYFVSGDETIEFTASDTDFTKTTTITFDVNVFDTPGVYRYKVTETIPETSDQYEGITYSEEVYYIDLYVVNGTSGLEIDAVIVLDSEFNKIADEDFVFTNEYATNNLTLEKVITGNQSNQSATFNFTVKIDGADGEQYATDQTDSSGNPIVLTSGEDYTFTLGNGDSLTIYGLTESDTYTIEEQDDYNTGSGTSKMSTDGYSTTITGADTMNDLTATGYVETDGDESITYTNSKEVTTPTGVALTIAPYALMVALAAVVAVVFLRKKNYEI